MGTHRCQQHGAASRLHTTDLTDNASENQRLGATGGRGAVGSRYFRRPASRLPPLLAPSPLSLQAPTRLCRLSLFVRTSDGRWAPTASGFRAPATAAHRCRGQGFRDVKMVCDRMRCKLMPLQSHKPSLHAATDSLGRCSEPIACCPRCRRAQPVRRACPLAALVCLQS